MGSVMLLSAQDAAKFWPIYEDYDTQLTKLNIKEYAQNYDDMTDAKADELIQKSIAYQKERAELLAQTYEKVKQALGAVTAARFAMVEHQLLLIIDLKIASSLPVAQKSS
jgi:NAD-dependent DNA ligase